MMKRMLAALCLSVASSTAAAIGDISASSALGRRLLSEARSLENGGDYSFLTSYSIKFQGCHHVQQWNQNADEENDVRIMTKRLARFRLCPTDQCSHTKSAGCTSKFGDYVVDLDTFVEAYLEQVENERDDLCAEAYADCSEECGNGGNDDEDCLASCYDAYGVSYCQNYNNNNGDNNNNGEGGNDFNVREYAACAQFDMPEGYNYYNQDEGGDGNNNNGGGRRRRLEDGQGGGEVQYYIGAFCADQGGEIHLGLFTDDTCTTFAQNGYSQFYAAMGYEMPYSESSLITTRCLACVEMNDNGNYQSKEVCENSYAMAGKCETRMEIDYPNESSCNYIEGIKIIREDGVIRTSSTKKSKTAAVAIGLFTTTSVLLAAYVYYLRTKLARAQINLSAASQPLT
jgi:hypothetical protein